MENRNGSRPNREGRGGRAILAARPTAVVSLIADLDTDGIDINAVGTWGNALVAAARLWLMRGGYAERSNITPRDADRILRAELAKAGVE